MYSLHGYIFLVILTLVCVGIFILSKRSIALLENWILIKKRCNVLDHYSEILTVFEQAKEVAYKKVWQEEIALENVSGFRIETGKMKTIQNRFVKLVLQYCGPNIVKDFEEIHGGIEPLMLFLIAGFVIKLNEDELSFRKLIVDGGIEEEGVGKTFVSKLFGMKSPSGVENESKK